MKIDFAHARGEARSWGQGQGGLGGGGGGGQEVARRVRRHWDKLYNCSIHTPAQPSPAHNSGDFEFQFGENNRINFLCSGSVSADEKLF